MTRANQIYNMGKAPYRFIGAVSMPSKSLAEHNVEVYNNALKEIAAIGMKSGFGTCSHCGMAIMNIFIIQDANNDKFGVGCECIKHITNDVNMLANAETAKKRLLAEKRQAKAREKREKRQAEMLKRYNEKMEKQRERNGGLTDQELHDKKQAEKKERKLELLKPLAERLSDGKGGFRDSVSNGLFKGQLPYGKGVDIMLDILSKQIGRVDSKAYNTEFERLESILDRVESI